MTSNITETQRTALDEWRWARAREIGFGWPVIDKLPAEPDQDTLDAREIVVAACYGKDLREQAADGSLDDEPWVLAVKAALRTILDRVRHEEREAVCKWLRERVRDWEEFQPTKDPACALSFLTDAIERGDHRT